MNNERLKQLQQLRHQRDVARREVEELTEIYTANFKTCIDTINPVKSQFANLDIKELREVESLVVELLKIQANIECTDHNVLAAVYTIAFAVCSVPEWLQAQFSQLRDELRYCRAAFLRTFRPAFDFFISLDTAAPFAYFNVEFAVAAYEEYEQSMQKYVTRQAILLAKTSLYDYYADLQQELRSVLCVEVQAQDDAVFGMRALEIQYKSFALLWIARSALLPVLVAFSQALQHMTTAPPSVLNLYEKASCDRREALLSCADVFKDGEIAFGMEQVPLSEEERAAFGTCKDVVEFLTEEMRAAASTDEFVRSANFAFRVARPLHLDGFLEAQVCEKATELLQCAEERTLHFLEFCDRNFADKIPKFAEIRQTTLLGAARQLMQAEIDTTISHSGAPDALHPYFAAEIAEICRGLWEADGARMLDSMRYLGVANLCMVVDNACAAHGNIPALRAWIAGFEFAADSD